MKLIKFFSAPLIFSLILTACSGGTSRSVGDQIPPEIIVTGLTTLTLEAGSVYTDQGATAKDNLEGKITKRIVTVNAVNSAVPGIYRVTYTVKDNQGNVAVKTRTVKVVDTTLPVLSLLGNANLTIDQGSVYTDAGATAADNIDGNVTANIAVVNNVDPNTIGNYTVTYSVIDASGNVAAQITRHVSVQALGPDVTVPTITLFGANPLTVGLNTTYIDPGAQAIDDRDGDISGNVTVGGDTVDTATLGSYTLIYNVSDAAGNAAVQISRVVNVVNTDITPPVITLLGANPQNINKGSAYVELNATATDNVDGDVSANIVIDSSAVNTAVAGSYNVTYNVADAAGNDAATVIRVVDVINAVPVAGPSSSSTSFQEGLNGYTGTQDTELRQISPAGNFDLGTGISSITIDGSDPSANDAQALLRFDNIFGNGSSTLIPPHSAITNATLGLYITSGGDSADMLQMLVDWSETAATWNSLSAGLTQGTDSKFVRKLNGRDVGGQFNGDPLDTTGAAISLDVTTELQNWSDGEDNFGWGFIPSSPTAFDGVDFNTKHTSTTTRRPQLTVSYSAFPAAVTAHAGKDLTLVLGGTDADNDPLTIRITNTATLNGALYQTTDGITRGTLIVDGDDVSNPDGQVIFAPTAAFTGQASLSYVVNDTFVDSNTATVTIDVTNVAPNAGLTSGPALIFDGVNDYVNGPKADILRNQTALTVSAWVKRSSNDNTDRIVSYSGDTWGAWELVIFNNEVSFEVSNGSAWFNSGASTTPLATNVWYHVTGVWDGSNVSIYVDGTQESTAAANITLHGTDPDDHLWIGRSSSAFATDPGYFAGSIDEVRIWDNARSQAQIQADRITQLTGNEAGLIGYWNFDENTGTSANDSTANANHGTLGGGVAAEQPAWESPASTVFAIPTQANVQSGVNQSLYLGGRDADGDALSIRITSLPTNGSLFQADGTTAIDFSNPGVSDIVSDANGQVVFNATTGGVDTFTFVANDGTVDSTAATVTVDVTAPVGSPTLTLTGANPQIIVQNVAFAELGFTATAGDGSTNINGSVVISNGPNGAGNNTAVNTAIVGTYKINYSVTDNAITVDKTRDVYVVVPGSSTWLGINSTNWNDAANWYPNGVPTAAKDVYIPAQPNNNATLTANASANNVTVENGATLDVGAFTLTTTGNVTAGNTIVGTGNVTVTGTGVLLQGTFPNLTITGTALLSGTTTTTGGVTVSNGGAPSNLNLNGNSLIVAGNFNIPGNHAATLTMLTATDTLTVAGNVSFAGQTSTTGLLTNGTINVGGNFTASFSGTSFAPSGLHTVVFNGATAQAVNISSSGATNRRFHNLVIANTAGGVDFLNNTQVNGQLISPTNTPSRVHAVIKGTGQTITVAGGVNVVDMTIDNVFLDIALGGAGDLLNSVTFKNFAPADTQLTLSAPVGGFAGLRAVAAGFTVNWQDMNFLTTPSTGNYISATGDAILNVSLSRPQYGFPKVLTDGFFTVNWGSTADDTDGDGISDADEFAGTNGFVTDPINEDTDNDGLDDGEEIATGTSPTNPDSDGDGIGDGIEAFLNSDPLVANTNTPIYVSGSNGNDVTNGGTGWNDALQSIGAALAVVTDGASASDASYILVEGNTSYAGPFTITGFSNLHIIGSLGSGIFIMPDILTSTLQGDGTASTVKLDGVGNVTIGGFTITGGGGANGGGLFVTGNSVAISAANVIEGNTATTRGGGFYVFTGSELIVNFTRISNNTAPVGGGGSVFGGTLTVMDESVFANNTATAVTGIATSGGGGLEIFGNATVNIVDSFFLANASKSNGGAILVTGTAGVPTSSADVTLHNNLFAGNLATFNGGGIAVHTPIGAGTMTALAITSNTLANNQTNGALRGGGLSYDANDGAATLIVKDNILFFNDDSNASVAVAGDDLNDSGSFGLTLTGIANFNDIAQGIIGGNDISIDPTFQFGFYLDQTLISPNGPVDAGSVAANTVFVNGETTNTQGGDDTGMIDMGFHYMFDNGTASVSSVSYPVPLVIEQTNQEVIIAVNSDFDAQPEEGRIVAVRLGPNTRLGTTMSSLTTIVPNGGTTVFGDDVLARDNGDGTYSVFVDTTGQVSNARVQISVSVDGSAFAIEDDLNLPF